MHAIENPIPTISVLREAGRERHRLVRTLAPIRFMLEQLTIGDDPLQFKVIPFEDVDEVRLGLLESDLINGNVCL